MNFFLVVSIAKHPMLVPARQTWLVIADDVENATSQIELKTNEKGASREVISVREIKERQEPILLNLSLT